MRSTNRQSTASRGKTHPWWPSSLPGKLDIQKNFYLVPILQHQDLYLGDVQARMLQVASVPLRNPTPAAASNKAAKPAPAAKHYTAGLTFVIDSTLSMDPYIDRTREAVMKIYDSLGDAGLLGNVNFGLVAFRDDPKSAPGLDYRTRTYVTLEQGRDPGTFLTQINNLKGGDRLQPGLQGKTPTPASSRRSTTWTGTGMRHATSS